MMPLTISAQHLKFNLPIPQKHEFLETHMEAVRIKNSGRTKKVQAWLYPRLRFICPVLTRVSSDDRGAFDATSQQSAPSEVEELRSDSSNSNDGYVALFVRMLGLDHDPLDREQAIVALWKHSLGGKQYIDAIMKFHGVVNLTISLLKSESNAACEAAAGLLRMISSVNIYRDLVAEGGAIEEVASLLRRSSVTSDVKEQSLCMLWNLSVDEKVQVQIASSDLMSLLIKFLDDEEIKVKEAAGGVLANLALNRSNHNTMVEAGVIPQLAKLLKADAESSKVLRKEAKNALLELAKDEYYKILVIEEGLVLVPLVGAEAYKSFKPALHSWPSLPDGTEIKQNSKGPSRFGASELLLGLHVEDKSANLEEAKMNAIVGRTQQQFLARIGAIEMEDENKSDSESSSNMRFTILPWMDGVARMVLILELQDESAVARAAEAIADYSISEHMRVSFKEAGAVKHLVQLMDHSNDSVRLAVIHALERLSVSHKVCRIIETEGALDPLIRSLKKSDVSTSSTDMILNILARILDPGKEMKSKFHDGPVNGSRKGWNKTRNTSSVGHVDETPVSKLASSLQTMHENELLDSTFLACLVGILKTPSPVLQRKAASILEFMAATESCADNIVSLDIESAFDAVFQQKFLNEKADMEMEMDFQQPELQALELEEAGLAISAASRLLTRLLDFDQFRCSVNVSHFTKSLRKILISNIPLHNKDWVAACLVKLSSLSGPNNLGFENPINTEVTLYETIPRLIEQITGSFSPQDKEIAVVELNRIISEGVVDSTRAVAAEGGIFPLVKLIEEGNERVVEAGLAILYNLSMDPENHPAILAAGAVPALRRIVLSERPQWIRALHLLRTLPT